ncbi:hypothetical protein J2S46_004357 [Kitasatospora herbaricolor]|uniref:hypothetical protein n=1 Tax=Kitasatospora herbaricolor TaxID=68217 RepID=UPI001749E5ED|nr:hypothetical protein [Kitasatospora herbaricolor]MDQ0309801.1 hypothetical protein [Kitasatospora herbaricolor]
MSAPENAPPAAPADPPPVPAGACAPEGTPVPDASSSAADGAGPQPGPADAAAARSATAPTDVPDLPEAAAAAGRRLPRAAGVALTAFALLAVTATSAAVTVVVGRPDARTAVAQGAPAPAAAPASATPSASPSPSPSPVVTLTAPPAPAPRPSSTLHGTVNGGTHGGDLRYFFAPVPDGAESFGPADGFKMSDEELVAEYDGQKNIMSVLASYGYKESAERSYRTADGKANVRIRLMRFSSAGNASEFAKGASFSESESIDVSGVPGARGFLFKPEQKAYTGAMVGIASKGDVEFEITVEVKGDPDKASLGDVMKRQLDRLSSGG